MNIITEIKPKLENNEKVKKFLSLHWGSENIVSKGKITNASEISRVLVKDKKGEILGLATFLINSKDNSCELVSINAKDTGKGIGSKLIMKVEEIAKERKVEKIWLVTTNDNYEAAVFYIKKGYRLVKVHKDALDISRKLKPQIPLKGKHNIFLQDEWEFEKLL
jgi:N-acetylglutamate synthase-like GNAT family acetyltransferase